MSQKAYGKGSSPPPSPAKGIVRLYSMRFCPFAKRVRLVLIHKKIQHEIININLDEKPEWFLEKFPEGKVPAIELNGRCLTESVIIAEYLDESFEGMRVLPIEPYEKARDRILVSKFSKIAEFVYKIRRTPAENVEEIIQEYAPAVLLYEEELKNRETTLFGGDVPSMLDFMIWPWFEMIRILPDVVDNFTLNAIFPVDTSQCLRNWYAKMKVIPAIKECHVPEIHKLFLKGMKDGQRNFDIGL